MENEIMGDLEIFFMGVSFFDVYSNYILMKDGNFL